ncbi:flagellar M-ring protein FliF [Heliorestis acidaminivorans]|uniref:Flagellar M-ring protein n=1 Tax=Heliorestis acidaminivorans TaxID=553427 RepID=A0A6I0FA35_9FIRM|nr:flagellar basal-body MS-ring/collar protein FliF [Heliorestis acidaminivorans]KAB2954398.1 flagellar M-ring protein FliF [Heliorestis acidaminivorans]
MNEMFEKLRTQLNELLGKLSRQQKFIIAGSIFAVLFTLLAFAFIAGRPDYVPLFSRLDPTDAGAIRAKLVEMNSDFKISEDGSTIFVPSKDQANLRLELANSGLPRGTGWGFETFSESRFSETEKEREIRLKVATETELARTLQNIAGVDNARVMIVPATDSLFRDNATDATASVMLIMRPFSQLEDEQVRGIVHLVSRSVKSLKPENVTVLDQNGIVLTEGLFNDNLGLQLDGLTKHQMEAKSQFERHLEQKAQEMLNRVVGPGNAIVKVATELDFSQQEVRDSQFGRPVGPLSTREILESGEGTTGGAAPGVDANIPMQQEIGAGTSRYERSDIIINNEIPRTETHIITPPGSMINRLTVSVMIDSNRIDGEFDEQRQQQFEQAVARAVGIQYPIVEPQPGGRVEQISVVAMPFDRTAVDELNRLLAEEANMRNYLWIGAAVAVALAVAIASIFFIRKAMAKKKEEEKPVEMVQEEPLVEEVAPTPPVIELTPEERERLALREQIEELTESNPEAVARLLKTWLAEDSR